MDLPYQYIKCTEISVTKEEFFFYSIYYSDKQFILIICTSNWKNMLCTCDYCLLHIEHVYIKKEKSGV